MDKKILALLYRSLDQELTAAEQKKLEQALEAFSELRREQERLTTLRQILSEEPIATFKPFFAGRVMRRIRQVNTNEDFAGSLFWAFRRVAIAGAIAIALLLANNVLIEKDRTLDDMLNMPQWTLNEAVQLDLVVVE